MRLNTNSSVKLISFFPLVLLVLLSSYVAYTSYQEYQGVQEFKNRLQSNQILKNLSINLAKERGLSATYMGSKGKLAKRILINQRKLTNKSIKELNDYFKNRPIDATITKVFKALIQISNIRNSIDRLDTTFDKMFFDYYSKINALMYDYYKKIIDIQTKPEIVDEVALETDLFRRMDKSGRERGFISYIISKAKPLSTEEFSKWIRNFAQADLRDINININDKSLKNQLFSLIHNPNAKKLYANLVKAKINIIEGSDIGYYQITPQTWFSLWTQKIDILNRASDMVSFNVELLVDKWLEDEVRPKLIIAAGVLFLSLLLMIVGFFIDRYIKRSTKELAKLFNKVGELADIDEEIDFQTSDGIEKGYRIIEIAIDQIQQDKKIALEASKAKSIFLANMSHEIRTPLNGIIGFTELLKNTDISGEERDFVDIIEKSSENLLEIINNILDLSKIESDKIEIEEILFSPITEFENAVEVFAAKAAEKNIRLSFFMDPSLNNYLNGDPTKIKEVLINLISNAIKFTPIDGEIDVEVKRIGSVDAFGRTKVHFSVQDSGIGISEDKLKTIFDAFSQADSTITRKYGGTGLGLTISSRFVSMMGGKLEVESKVGEGTRFFFTLEFDESPSSEFNFKNEFTEFKCALLASEKDKKYHTQYVYDYLNYFGCDVIYFYNSKDIKNLTNRKDINFVILDVDYIDDSEIEEYKHVPIPGIVILKSSMQSISSKYTTDYLKALYEPVNVTKLANILKNQKELLPKVEKVQPQTTSYEGADEQISSKEHGFEIKKPHIVQDEHVHAKEEQQSEEIGGKLKILVAEDNDINRKLIKRTLENYNVEVTLANNGQEALEMVKNRKFDIIFMDIAMPVMDGVEALHAILSQEINTGTKHTPIVALTANALKGDRERFLSEGFDEYITKPIKSSSIEAILQMFTGKRYLKESENKESSNDDSDNVSEDTDKEKQKEKEDTLKIDKSDGIKKLKVTFDEGSDFYSGFEEGLANANADVKQVLKSETEELKPEVVEEEDISIAKEEFAKEEHKEQVKQTASFIKQREIEPLDVELESSTKEPMTPKDDIQEEIESLEAEIKTSETEQNIAEVEVKEELKPEKIEHDIKSEIVEEIKTDSEDKESKKDNLPTQQKDPSEIEILIAEDNAINQKLIEKTLTSLGLKVEISNNGEEALEMFKKKKYDIVFMDISMPVMDGIEATHEILAYEKENGLEHTPVVALTANALPGDREAFLSEGLDEYISKPLKKEDIVKVLKLFLNYQGDNEKTKDESNKEAKHQNTYNNLDEDLDDIEKSATSEEKLEKEELNTKENIAIATKDVLVYKNNKIEAKILSNMIEKMGYSADRVYDFDEFLMNMESSRYKVVFFDKDIEFVDSNDIIEKIQKMDKQRGEKTFVVELVTSQDSDKDEDLGRVDEIMDNIINKKRVREILEKYI